MQSNSKILLTGAAGFIGSYMLGYLNRNGFNEVVIVDDFNEQGKESNYQSKQFIEKVERVRLFDWLEEKERGIEYVLHLGARTDTTEFDYTIHEKLNLDFSKKLWIYCTEKMIPFVYASSAATYGSGEWGYKDDHDLVDQLQPLNPYGVSKNEFDKWALRQAQEQQQAPPFWAGLKFFNVFGPNEYHKGRMASMVFHGFNQIQKNGKVKLFRSHRKEYRDGEQLRDFIYVEDVAAVCLWFLEQPNAVNHQSSVKSGLYNLGTGIARSFNDLISAVFAALGKPVKIEYVDTPEDIRDKYQYFTEADMNKLREEGYKEEFFTLEDGINDYVINYLSKKSYY